MTPKSFLIVTRNSLLAELEYRFNYFMWFLSAGISFAMESAALLLATAGTTELGGFHRADLWKYVLAGIMVRSCTGQWKVVGEAIEEIREGGFRKYLLQPILYPAYFLARCIGDKITITSIFTLAMIGVKWLYPEGPYLSGNAPLYFFLSFSMVALLNWLIYMVIIYLAFWFDETHFLQIAYNIGMAVFAGTLLPYSWLPNWVKAFVDWTPFQILGDWPVRSALGRMASDEFLHLGMKSLLWFAILSLTVFLMGRMGRRHYEAFGG